MFVVSNCFDWIGYHLTNKFLNEGIRVVGIDRTDTEKKEHLSMFFDRNSLFKKIHSFSEIRKEYKKESVEALFELDGDKTFKELDNQEVLQHFILNTRNSKVEKSAIKIKYPLLYGEWMPREEKGFYQGEEFIHFDSRTFQEEAIDIDDFAGALRQLATLRKLPKTVEFKSINSQSRSDPNQDLLFVRQSKPMKSRLRELDDHYKRFRFFY